MGRGRVLSLESFIFYKNCLCTVRFIGFMFFHHFHYYFASTFVISLLIIFSIIFLRKLYISTHSPPPTSRENVWGCCYFWYLQFQFIEEKSNLIDNNKKNFLKRKSSEEKNKTKKAQGHLSSLSANLADLCTHHISQGSENRDSSFSPCAALSLFLLFYAFLSSCLWASMNSITSSRGGTMCRLRGSLRPEAWISSDRLRNAFFLSMRMISANAIEVTMLEGNKTVEVSRQNASRTDTLNKQNRHSGQPVSNGKTCRVTFNGIYTSTPIHIYIYIYIFPFNVNK